MSIKKEKNSEIPYLLLISFGRKQTISDFGKKKSIAGSLIFSQQQVKELCIIQDLNSFLPSVDFKIEDSQQQLSALLPFDKNLSRMSVIFNRNTAIDDSINFDFDIYRRTPQSNSIYECKGLLQADSIFSPSKIRSFTGNISASLLTIANELGCEGSDAEISPTLSFSKTLLQPNWNNAKFLNYLKNSLQDENGKGNFYCFVKCKGKKRYFVFKTMEEFAKGELKYIFSDAPEVAKEGSTGRTIYPISEYKVFDNYKLLGSLGCAGRNYSYFDFDNSKFVMSSIDYTDYYSLSQYFLIDSEDSKNNNIGIATNCRSNAFTSNFSGLIQSMYYRDLDSLSKIWITSIGIEDICPGDVVLLKFVGEMALADITSHSYRGYWVVERVVQILGKSFQTRLLLTRSGIDTDRDTTLVSSSNINRRKYV
jgi:hypothetical protein